MQEKTENNKRPLLVLGIGNILLTDEGVGVHAVNELSKHSLPDYVELFDGGTEGADLLDLLAERKKVIVVDAMAGEYEIGSIVRFRSEMLEKPQTQDISLHDLGINETLAMTKLLGCEPDDVVFFGVKPASLKCGTSLSPQVSQVMPKLLKLVIDEINSFKP